MTLPDIHLGGLAGLGRLTAGQDDLVKVDETGHPFQVISRLCEPEAGRQCLQVQGDVTVTLEGVLLQPELGHLLRY